MTLSRGINHGNQASYCTVFHLETLTQAWAYPFWTQLGSIRNAIVLSCAVFLGDMLCVLASHDDGPRLHWLDLSDEAPPRPRPPRDKRQRKARSEMSPTELEERRKERAERLRKPPIRESAIRRLAEVHHLQACGSQEGVYLTGLDRDGALRTVWRPIPAA